MHDCTRSSGGSSDTTKKNTDICEFDEFDHSNSSSESDMDILNKYRFTDITDDNDLESEVE